MAKEKVSVTIDENLLEFIDGMLEDGRFRNRSHVFEYGLKKLISDGGNL